MLQICYYGPTSAVHDPPVLDAQRSTNQQYSSPTSKGDVRTMLTSNAMESRAWEEFALGNAAFESNIPQVAMSKLLQIHWAWIAPMFMWVYRPAFMRKFCRHASKTMLINIQGIWPPKANTSPSFFSRSYVLIRRDFKKAALEIY